MTTPRPERPKQSEQPNQPEQANQSKPEAHYDIAIIGGGPAGLSAAIAATRMMQRSVVVESAAPPRNAASHGAHGLIGLDTSTPAEVRSAAWTDLDRYGLAVRREADVTDVSVDPGGGFLVEIAQPGAADRIAGEAGDRPGTRRGTLWARDVILATGVVDEHPDIPGFAECWAQSVIHCPFCVGWENRDRTWGIVAHDPDHAIMTARAFRAWSGDILGIVPPDMPRIDEVRAAYKAAGNELIEARVTGLRHRDGSLHTVELDDGRTVDRQTLVWHLEQKPVPLVSRLAETLGLAVDKGGFVTVDGERRTNIPGLYAAGDLIVPMGQSVLSSVAAGGEAAASIGRAQMFAE
ncbi:NAD(P)/FAD-dependent oxidoreductase [Streptodolium elevatio]|uniref:NAD(P)/FAD-dependent oxidoreductase n=1 Tax=Streptodolium elevatio TaxID=3157996 RepID=A0ABV3DVW0_9ACTN